jgi:hypothetical protein
MLNEFYISSGAKNAQYTLRARYEDYGNDGHLKVFDQYIRNLGIDLERAKAAAAEVAGHPVEVEPFALNPYGHKTEEELALEAARAETRHLRQREYEINQARSAAYAENMVRQRQAENAKSQWQGTVGERITRKITCILWKAIGQGAYGVRYLAIFRDEQMNKYVFFGGCVSSLPSVNETAEVTFTVKEHSERDGCKQTIINRPKAVKVA